MYSFDKRAIFILASGEIIAIFFVTWSIVDSEPPRVYRTNPPGCYTTISNSRKIRMAGSWEGILATDLLFLGLTLYRAYSRSRDGIVLPAGSLWRVLVRDGVMYYALICVANLANILVYYFGDDIDISAGLYSFTVPLSVAMVCRLMLNLHKAASMTNDSACSMSASIQFAPWSMSPHESGVFDTASSSL